MDKQKKLFEEVEEHWTKEWQDMPEFVQEDLTSFRKIVVHFKNNDDVEKFSKLIGQKITPKQPSLRYLDEKIEDEGVRRGRETAEYLKGKRNEITR